MIQCPGSRADKEIRNLPVTVLQRCTMDPDLRAGIRLFQGHRHHKAPEITTGYIDISFLNIIRPEFLIDIHRNIPAGFKIQILIVRYTFRKCIPEYLTAIPLRYNIPVFYIPDRFTFDHMPRIYQTII